jgi:hypothetical protein
LFLALLTIIAAGDIDTEDPLKINLPYGLIIPKLTNIEKIIIPSHLNPSTKLRHGIRSNIYKVLSPRDLAPKRLV